MKKVIKTKAGSISLLIAVVLFINIFTGCASGGSSISTEQLSTSATSAAASTTASAAVTTTESATEESTEIVPGSLPIVKGDKITLTAFWPSTAEVLRRIGDLNSNSIFPILENETNIHIEFQHGNVEQFQLMINSGDLTDILYAPDNSYMYPGGGDKGIADGVYLRLNEILDKYGKHYKELIESTPMFRRDSRTDTGNIYGFSMVENVIQGAYTGMIVRRDWFEDLGLDNPPVTYDDWHKMLTLFKNEKGASAPLLLPENLFPDNFVLSSGFGVGYTPGRPFYQDNGKVKFGPIEPAFKDYITLMAQWYSEGLIDPDFPTRDGASREQLIFTKQAGAWHGGFWTFENYKRLSEDSDVFRMTAVPNPVLKAGDKTSMRQFNHNVRGQWTMISAKSKYPIEATRWVDNLYSESNWLLTNYGVEGEGFTWVDGKPQYTDLILKNPDGLTPNVAQVQYMLQSGPMLRDWTREFPGYSEDELSCEAIWNTSSADSMIPIHLITLTADESEEYVRIMNDINTYVQETCTKYVMGLQDLNDYDSFVARINSMDIETAIKHQQAALDRYYARQ